ncbi:hypothetical protein [Clostridium cellulovorans]|uniref:Uncharacterized protein n=1 Tax=Clostridium cellulovorans (strain ATCC 35296 / DSM 3052 / OCM 3 / 743B) TaxID=573061 RepID=D9SU61_CLOC7|nr:hypothetical protein [Clostridium cellulovorans]ADL50899.1 hypothetical protein Clocel_1143 [Clostridium cellulovorans 743B]
MKAKLNKEFMDIYSAKKEKKEVRSLVRLMVFCCNLMNYIIVNTFNLAMYNKLMSWNQTINFFIIMSVYNLISLILYIFPKKLEVFIDLYTAITYIGTSIVCFYFSMKIFMKLLGGVEACIIIVISIIVYVFLIFAIMRNIKDKMRNGFRKIKINKGLVGSITSLCAALGIIISKTTYKGSDRFTPAIVLLIMSYLFTPTIIGIHKFYFKVKRQRNCK